MQSPVERNKALDELLISISDSIDITSSQYEEVIERYDAIAKYLAGQQISPI